MNLKTIILIIIIYFQIGESLAQNDTQIQSDIISHKAQLEDLNFLKSKYESYHAGLYRYTSKDSIDLVFKQVKNRIKQNFIVDFYAEITWLLNKVRCLHTRGFMSTDARNAFNSSQYFSPVSVKYLGDKLYVDKVYSNEGLLEKGLEILSINDKSIDHITNEIFEHISSDGHIDINKYRRAERYFQVLYLYYVERDVPLYKFKVRELDGLIRTVSIAGLNWEAFSQIKLQPIEQEPLLSLEFKSNHALMGIGLFEEEAINDGGQNYLKFLEDSFTELKKRRINNLVLDLRGNGGGEDNYGATLVSYFAKSAFKYFDRIEVTEQYAADKGISKQRGKNLITGHKGLDIWQAQKNRFEGNVYILTDGWGGSTCADVVSVMYHNKIGVIIGSEIGGGYNGNNSGDLDFISLPNSEISVTLPMWMYTTANNSLQFYGHGVVPDFRVQQAVQEFIEGKDAVMNKAIELIDKR